MTDDWIDLGPMHCIEQQISHYESLALSYDEDAEKFLKRALESKVKAKEANLMADRYKQAHEKLKSNG